MKKLLASAKNFIRDEEGATAVEYGIMVAAIAAAIVIIVIAVGNEVKTGFMKTCESLKGALGTSGASISCTGA